MSVISGPKGRYALIFPGQGAQEVGMGRDLAESFSVARDVFRTADESLDFPLSRLIFEGPEEELQKTEYTQPAILTVSIAAFRALSELSGEALDPVCFAGHSLGEYTAHVAAGTLSLEQALPLVRLRGRLMQEAVPLGQGTMAAILGLEAEDIEAVCREAAREEVCDAANFNAPSQTVISGHVAAVERALALAKGRGAKKAIPLKVSAPFHCSLMRPVADALRKAFEPLSWRAPSRPIVANVDASPVIEVEGIRSALETQTYRPVRWAESVRRMAEMGATGFIELGPGNVLSGLVKRIAKESSAFSVRNAEECRAALDFLKKDQ